MKKTVKYILLLLTVIAVFGLTGCSNYSSHYKAMMYVHSNTSDKAEISFSTFEGTGVYKLKCRDSSEKLKYTGKLDKGSATVYYDNNGTKTELFRVGAGEEVDSVLEGLEKGTIYIILETDGKCEEGKFVFEN